MNHPSHITDTTDQIQELQNKGFTIEQIPDGMTPFQAVVYFQATRLDWRVIIDFRDRIHMIAFREDTPS